MTILTPVVELYKTLIGLFKSEDVAVLILLAMLGVFAVATAYIWLQHRQYLMSLKSAAQTLRDALARTDWISADRLNAADAGLKANQVVGAAWSRYRISLREDPTKPGNYINFIEPSC
jgi:CHASE1-domain containing sensor protein